MSEHSSRALASYVDDITPDGIEGWIDSLGLIHSRGHATRVDTMGKEAGKERCEAMLGSDPHARLRATASDRVRGRPELVWVSLV
jgi:hypothetical protein